MDILLVNSSIYSLPSTQRAGAIVYDGACDLGLWRPPGPDRELLDVYGETLYDVLDKERKSLPEGTLRLGEVLRLHPGKLHCDFLIWAASRPAHGTTSPAPAPDGTLLASLVRNSLALAARYGKARVAFPALGAGPGALDAAERVAIVARAAREYSEACTAEGRSPGIDEVLVCERSAMALAKARQAVAGIARSAQLPAAAPAAKTAAPRRAATKAAPRKTARTRTAAPKLDEGDVAMARARSAAYDRTETYHVGNWFIHPKFGVGRVEEVFPERMMMVLFEDGEQRKMVHARP